MAQGRGQVRLKAFVIEITSWNSATRPCCNVCLRDYALFVERGEEGTRQWATG
ncbi:hypothetical protein NPIL_137861, partial [Nephila pilipes]